MNKKAYYRKLVELRTFFNSSSFYYVMDVIQRASKVNGEIENLDFSVFNGNLSDGNVQLERDKIPRAIRNAITEDKNTKVRHFGKCSLQIEAQLNGLVDFENIPSVIKQELGKFIELFDEFLDSYDDYRVDFRPGDYYRLSFVARDLEVALEYIHLILDICLDEYTSPVHDGDTQSLEIYLSNVTSLKQFGVKLQLVDDLYTNVCMLLDISLTDNPISIERIENGSLLARIAGSAVAVEIVRNLLSVGAAYYQNNYTLTGQITQIKETTEVLDNMFQVSEKLKSNGYDVEVMQDGIHRMLKKSVSTMDDLLSDQPVIEVDDQAFELNESIKTKLIEQSKLKLLENKGLEQEA